MTLSEKIADAYSQAKAIQNSTDALSSEQLTKIEGFLSTAETFEAQLKRETSINAKLAGASVGVSAVASVEPVITGVKELAKNDPKKGFKSPRDFFGSIIDLSKGKADSRLDALSAQGDGQSTINGELGGFIIPEAFSPTLLQTQADTNPFRGQTMEVPMGAPIINIPALVDKNHSKSISGGLTVSRRFETSDFKTSQMSFEMVKLEATEQGGAIFIPNALMTDSPISVSALASTGFQREFDSAEYQEFLNGSGVGEPLGCLNSANKSLLEVARAGAGLIDIDDVLLMRSRAYGYGQSFWIANQDALPQLGKLNANNGHSLNYMSSIQDDMPDRLMGRPIFYTEYAESIGAKGGLALINPTQYLTGNYAPIQSDESIHVAFLKNERCFKMWRRNDGRPWWASVLTPKKGQTLSPFVILGA